MPLFRLRRPLLPFCSKTDFSVRLAVLLKNISRCRYRNLTTQNENRLVVQATSEIHTVSNRAPGVSSTTTTGKSPTVREESLWPPVVCECVNKHLHHCREVHIQKKCIDVTTFHKQQHRKC